MSKSRISWADMLDVLTDSERRRNTILEKPSEIERMALFLLRREGFSAQLAPQTQKNFDLELFRPGERVAASVRNHRAKVHLGQIEKFLDFLADENAKSFSGGGIFISTSGFTPSVYAYLREEKIANLRLAILHGNQLIWNCEEIDRSDFEREKTIYVGVFTCKGGVGKTTIAAHLAGAFALNGYDVALLDLDRQQNLKKLLGEGVYLPGTKGQIGSVITVLSHEEWDETAYKDTKIVVCDCSPEFDANPADFIRNFDYCLIPTTLNPLGVNKNADVIKRTFAAVRRVNQKAHLHVLVNSLQSDEENRNALLNQVLKTQFKQLAERDARLHYIEPAECAIRFSKQLLYWGFHVFEGAKPQLAFRSMGGYSYPRLDFLKLVDYLESHTQIERARGAGKR
jgi:chromosome partitioning protein